MYTLSLHDALPIYRVKKTLQSLSPERNRSARRGPRKRSGPSCAQDARTYWYFGQNWRWRLLREIGILKSLQRLRVTTNSSILSGGGFPRVFFSAGDRSRRIFCFAFRLPIQLRHNSSV